MFSAIANQGTAEVGHAVYWRPVKALCLLGCIFSVAFPALCQGAAVVIAGNSSINMTKDDGPRNVTLGFFDDASGERIARLQIGLMTLGYRHQGVFRVAWKPQVTLTDVTLQLNDAAACKEVGTQLPEALRDIGATGSLRLRNVVIEIQKPTPLRVEAASAEFTPNGDLLLLQASRADGPLPTSGLNFIFRLNGADAGSLESLPNALLANVQSSPPVTLRNP